MESTPTVSLPAVKYEVIVQSDGRIQLDVPFLAGKRVVVFVIQEHDQRDMFDDLVSATASSTDFWDNAFDDEDWNHA